jgi:hypothetical protein
MWLATTVLEVHYQQFQSRSRRLNNYVKLLFFALKKSFSNYVKSSDPPLLLLGTHNFFVIFCTYVIASIKLVFLGKV